MLGQRDVAPWLWTAAIAVVVGDMATTLYGLSIGLSERNPVVAVVIAEFGLAGMIGLKAIAIGWVVAVGRILGRTYGLAALVGLILPQTAAVVLNVFTILSA